MSAAVLPTPSSQISGQVPRIHTAGLKSKDFKYKKKKKKVMGCLFALVTSCFFSCFTHHLFLPPRRGQQLERCHDIFSNESCQSHIKLQFLVSLSVVG